MNILLLDQFSDPGGAQFCLRDLMPEMIRRGWKPRLMVPGGGELVQWSDRLGVPTCTLPLRRYSNGGKTALDFLRFGVDVPRMTAAVRRAIGRDCIDLVYVNGPRALPAVLGVSCQVVFHAHNYIGARYGRKLLEWMVKTAGATVIAASRYVAERYVRVLGSEKVRVVYNGIRDMGGVPRTFDRRPARVGMIGRIEPEKGQTDLLRAARHIAEKGGGAEFFIYGAKLYADSVYDARVRTMAENAGVTLCGWTDDVSRALHNLEILAVPSGPGEAATRVIMEAFSAGTPVVAYGAGGIPELVENGRTGILTETRDSESLARSLEALIEDRASLARMAAAGREEWLRRFRIERFRTDVCDLLESCVQPKDRRLGWWEPGRASDGEAA
jgi:glycosyltransferase involved in cell wall biosynthesis